MNCEPINVIAIAITSQAQAALTGTLIGGIIGALLFWCGKEFWLYLERTK